MLSITESIELMELEEDFSNHLDLCYETFGEDFDQVVDSLLESDLSDDYSIGLFESYLSAASETLFETIFEARDAKGKFRSDKFHAAQSAGASFSGINPEKAAGPLTGGLSDADIASQYTKSYGHRGRLGRLLYNAGKTLAKYRNLGAAKIKSLLRRGKEKYVATKNYVSQAAKNAATKIKNIPKNTKKLFARKPPYISAAHAV